MKNNVFETMVGALVLILAVSLAIFAFRSADINAGSTGYRLLAKFDHIDGIQVGSDVKISGIKVGLVTKQYIDPVSYNAVIELSVNHNIKLPNDSAVSVTSEGLLGGKYVSISAGAENDFLAEGDEIKYTHSAANLETLIGKAVFNSGTNKTPEHK